MRATPILMLTLALGWTLRAEPWTRHTIDDSSRGADGVRLADVNRDGLLDVATGWEEGGLVRVYTHPGSSRVRARWPATTVGQVRSPEDAVLTDLDGDGAVDVVSCCEGKTRAVFVHWSPPPPARPRAASQSWITEPVPATQGRAEMWMFAYPADVDGRLGLDLVVGSKGPQATVSWLEAPHDPRDLRDWRLHPLRDAGWIMSLIMKDMDNDGDLDILFSDRKGNQRGVWWLENPGRARIDAAASWREHLLGGTDHEVMFLTLGDLTGDEREEIAAATSRGPLLVFTLGKSLKNAKPVEIPLPDGCGTGKGVAIGDLDLDGRADLTFTCENAQGELSGVRWLSRRTATPDVWQDHEISGPAGAKYDRVELLDLDGDGDLDVLTCEERDNLGVIWYENPVR